jgi:uncharacterized protein (TIGR03437 family)
MVQKLIPGELVSVVVVSFLALMGLGGSSQVACAQARAYVANNGDNTVSVIDTSSNTVVATIHVGSGPEGVALTPDGTRLYVANDGGAVWVIDTSNNTVVAKVTVGGDPYAVAITPDGPRVYVTQDNGAAVSAIDTSSNTVIAKMSVPAPPSGVVITPDGRHAYVASGGISGNTGSVSVIDTSSNTVVATVGLAGLPWGIAVTPDGTRIYVANSVPTISGGNGEVSVIDTSSNAVIANVMVGAGISWGMAITPDGRRAYAATGVLIGSGANNGAVSVIDTSSNTVIATVGVADPLGLAVTPDGTRVYVANDFNFSGASSVSVIDTLSNTVVATVGVGGIPEWVAIAKGAPKYTCTNTTRPVITFVDSASGYGGYSYFASGSWLEIKGANLADPKDPRLASGSGQWASADFNGPNAPTNLDGIGVSINNKPAYVWYLSPGQLNVQAPEDSTNGNVAITVTNCKATSSITMFSRRNLAPGLLAPPNYSSGGTQYLVATFASDGAYVLNTSLGASFGLNSRPAKPGDLIVAYGIGFGDVTPTILPGVIVGQSNALVNPITISFGSTSATLVYAGLAGNFVGLYEFFITVPSGLANGDYQINVTQNGIKVPQTMYLTVHN